MIDFKFNALSPEELREMLKMSVPTYHRLLKENDGLPPCVQIGKDEIFSR